MDQQSFGVGQTVYRRRTPTTPAIEKVRVLSGPSGKDYEYLVETVGGACNLTPSACLSTTADVPPPPQTAA